MLVVSDGHPFQFRCVNVPAELPDQWESRILLPLARCSEYANRTGVVGWCGQIDNEGLREQVRSLRFGCIPAVDEDVGKGRCCIAYISLFLEVMKQLSNSPIDCLRFIFVLGVSVSVDALIPGIDRGMVCLVINQQKRELGNHATPIWILLVRDMLVNPFEKSVQDSFVLLDDK